MGKTGAEEALAIRKNPAGFAFISARFPNGPYISECRKKEDVL
jgi:hypothetical protein